VLLAGLVAFVAGLRDLVDRCPAPGLLLLSSLARRHLGGLGGLLARISIGGARGGRSHSTLVCWRPGVGVALRHWSSAFLIDAGTLAGPLSRWCPAGGLGRRRSSRRDPRRRGGGSRLAPLALAPDACLGAHPSRLYLVHLPILVLPAACLAVYEDCRSKFWSGSRRRCPSCPRDLLVWSRAPSIYAARFASRPGVPWAFGGSRSRRRSSPCSR